MRSPMRRRILAAAAGGTVSLALGGRSAWLAPARAQSAPATVTSLGDTLHVIAHGGSNIVAATAGDATVLVDGGPAESTEALLAAVAQLPGAGPIDVLFNTHWHPQQTGANARIGAAGARILAQENTRLWLTTAITYPWDGRSFAPLPAAALPNDTFYDAGGTLETGARYGYLPHAAHTDGDLYVQFPAENVLAVGGAVSGDGWPLVDWWTGGWIGGIVGTLELLLSLSDAGTRFVAANGPVMQRATIERQYEMYNVIYDRLAEMLNRGRGPEEAVAARPTAEFDAVMGPSEEFVRLAFQSLWAYLSPDA